MNSSRRTDLRPDGSESADIAFNIAVLAHITPISHFTDKTGPGAKAIRPFKRRVIPDGVGSVEPYNPMPFFLKAKIMVEGIKWR